MGKETTPMKKKSAVLVCVTGQRDCDRLIKVGRQIADQEGLPVQVLCVLPIQAGGKDCSEELEYLRQTARDADAEMTVFFHDEPALMAVGFVKQINAVHIVTGMAEAPVNGFVEVVHNLLPKIPVAMVGKDGTVYHLYPQSTQTSKVKAMA